MNFTQDSTDWYWDPTMLSIGMRTADKSSAVRATPVWVKPRNFGKPQVLLRS